MTNLAIFREEKIIKDHISVSGVNNWVDTSFLEIPKRCAEESMKDNAFTFGGVEFNVPQKRYLSRAYEGRSCSYVVNGAMGVVGFTGKLIV